MSRCSRFCFSTKKAMVRARAPTKKPNRMTMNPKGISSIIVTLTATGVAAKIRQIFDPAKRSSVHPGKKDVS